MSKRVVVITGSRDWQCFDLAVRVLSDLVARTPDGLVVHHGDARGVDRSFRDAAEFVGVKQVPHPADWDRLGKKAGPVRNSEMVSIPPDVVLAFHPKLEGGGGTFDCACKALNARIPLFHFWSDRCEPLRVRSLRRGKIDYEDVSGDGACR